MSKTIIYIFLLFSGLTMSQTPLKGKYCVEYPTYDQFTCIDLKDNGKFIFSEGGHLGGPKNHFGTFVFENEYLILNYNNKNSKPLSYHKSQIWRNDKDSITMNISVYDFQENPIEHIFISPSSDKNRKGLPPSFPGKTTLKFSKKIGKEQITTGFVGYENYSFEIDLNYNYTVDVFLAESHQVIPIRNHIDSIWITDIRVDQFTTNKKTIWKRKTD